MKRRITKKILREVEGSLASIVKECLLSSASPPGVISEQTRYLLSLSIATLVLEYLRLDSSSPYRKRWSDGIGWCSISPVRPSSVVELGELWWGSASDIAAGMVPEPLLARLRLSSYKESKVSYWIKLGTSSELYYISNSKEECIKCSFDTEVNSVDCFGETSLIRAISKDDFEGVNILIERGADVNIATQTGFTALMLAAMFGQESIIRTLLAGKVDTNMRADGGVTALMLASRFGHVGIVEALLNKGANVGTRNDWGETALALAQNRSCIGHRPYGEIIRLLVNAGAIE